MTSSIDMSDYETEYETDYSGNESYSDTYVPFSDIESHEDFSISQEFDIKQGWVDTPENDLFLSEPEDIEMEDTDMVIIDEENDDIEMFDVSVFVDNILGDMGYYLEIIYIWVPGKNWFQDKLINTN